MKRILLTTVSNHKGENGNPVELILDRVKPDHAFFFVSRESLNVARGIARQSYLGDDIIDFALVTDPFDLEGCYQIAVQTFDKIMAVTADPWLHVDITAGTKPMSMALLLRSFQLLDELDERIFVSYIEQNAETKAMHLRYLPDKRFQFDRQ